jgi:hypothetical protein
LEKKGKIHIQNKKEVVTTAEWVDIPFLVMDFYYNYDSFSYWVPCCDFYSCFLNDPFCCSYHFLFILYINGWEVRRGLMVGGEEGM